MRHLVFVYGTLRRKEVNHQLLEGAVFLGNYQTPPEYALYDLGLYPGLIYGEQSVCGEVYAVNSEQLRALDALEDIPTEYRREKIHTTFGIAWIYLYQDVSKLTRRIHSGDWCRRS